MKRLAGQEDTSWTDRSKGLLTNLSRAATSTQLSAQYLANSLTWTYSCYFFIGFLGRGGLDARSRQGRGGETGSYGGNLPGQMGGGAQILGGDAHPEPLSNYFLKGPGCITLLSLLLLPSFVFSTNKPES